MSGPAGRAGVYRRARAVVNVVEARLGGRRAGALVRHAEMAVGIGATAVALYLSFRFAAEAGPLWRDEVSAVHLATLSHFSDVLRALSVESMPALYPTLLRLWASVGWMEEDAALRFLGFVVAICTLAAVWVSARMIAVAVPLLTLVVFGLHGAVLQTEGAVKPYGLGAVLMLAVFAGVWRVASAPGAGAIVWTAAAAILAVNTLYQNLPLLVACCVAAVCARAVEHDRRGMLRVCVVGLIGAGSLLPYAGIVANSKDWRALVHADNSVRQLLTRLVDIGSDWSREVLVVWAVAGAVSVIVAARTLKAHAVEDRGRLVYVAATAIGCPVALLLFFKAASANVEPWHVASLIAIAALCLDAILARTRPLRALRFGLAVAASVMLLPIASSWVGVRQTNVDLLATYIGTTAHEGDVIVLNPWFLGVTFIRYYGGRAPWITIPPIQDVRIHRYDLVKAQMQNVNAMAPVYRAMQAALQSGHRVWLVGGAQFLPVDTAPEILPPAPLAPTGWRTPPYYRAWSRGVGRFAQTHAVRLTVEPVKSEQPIWRTEAAILMVADGWRGP